MPRPIPKGSKTRLLRLLSARVDLGFASDAYRLFTLNTMHESREHSLQSMVVCYCRPFTENSGIGSLMCEYPNLPDFADAEMNLLHHRMMELRNRFFGHSCREGLRVSLLAPGAINPITGLTATTYEPMVEKRHFNHPEFAPRLFETIQALTKRLDADIEAACFELGSTYLKPQDIVEIETGADDFQWRKTS